MISVRLCIMNYHLFSHQIKAVTGKQGNLYQVNRIGKPKYIIPRETIKGK